MSGLQQQRVVYSDFDINLDMHPISDDIVRITNENAIIRSVKNLVSTNFYERPFKHNIGCNIRKLLFENFTIDIQEILKQTIIETITSFEPRVAIIEVLITPYEDENALNVSLTFSILNREEPVTLDLYLDRIR